MELATGTNDELGTLLRGAFSSEEQRLFLDGFQAYLQHDPRKVDLVLCGGPGGRVPVAGLHTQGLHQTNRGEDPREGCWLQGGFPPIGGKTPWRAACRVRFDDRARLQAALHGRQHRQGAPGARPLHRHGGGPTMPVCSAAARSPSSRRWPMPPCAPGAGPSSARLISPRGGPSRPTKIATSCSWLCEPQQRNRWSNGVHPPAHPRKTPQYHPRKMLRLAPPMCVAVPREATLGAV